MARLLRRLREVPIATVAIAVSGEDFDLDRAMASALAQTCGGDEIVAAMHLEDEYAIRLAERRASDPRLKIIASKARRVGDLLNEIFQCARCDVFAVCGATSAWSSNRLATHIRHLKSDSRVGVSAPLMLKQAEGAVPPPPKRLRAVDVASASDNLCWREPVFQRAALASLAMARGASTSEKAPFRGTYGDAAALDALLRVAGAPDFNVEAVEVDGESGGCPDRRPSRAAHEDWRRAIEAASVRDPEAAKAFDAAVARREWTFAADAFRDGDFAYVLRQLGFARGVGRTVRPQSA